MSSGNLIANGNFATGDFTDWILGGNYTSANGPEILIETNAQGASTYAACLDSTGSDGTLSQTIATTAGQTYTLSFWLDMGAGGANNLSALWNGQAVLSLTNVLNSPGYTEYTYVVTATSNTSTLEFSAAGSPWFVDNVALTATIPTPPVISTGVENSNQSVTLTGTAPDGATVTVWDGSTALGTALATSSGAWSLTIADLSAGSYSFTATDPTTSTPSSSLNLTVTAAPTISTGVENSNQSVTLTGTAPDGATVTVYELTTSSGATTALGTATATSTGAWSFTTAALSAGIYDFTATDTTSAGTSAASSPSVVGVSSTNLDPVTYYVSSLIGHDNNAGTSASAPLATLQAAANLVHPGDTVEVMNGTYTAVDITTSGTASAPITFEAAPGQTPVINSQGSWNGINIQASYIIIDGFTVVGDAASYNLATATAAYSTGDPNLDGNGIGINPSSGVSLPNHITIENNTVYNEPGGGIYTEGADYVQILNNVVFDNAHWSAFGNSGISVSESANLDTNPGVHILVSGNLSFGNADLVPTYTSGTITDGEGIILDTNPNFTSEILVQDNTVYDNGSSGIESCSTPNAVITENTVYLNNVGNVQAPSVAEIFLNNSSTNTVTNNVTTAPPDLSPPAAPVISSDSVNGITGPVTVTLNGTAEAYSTVTIYDNSAQLGTTTTNGSGAWTFMTAPLADGSENFTATATDSAGNVSPLSSPLVLNLNVPVNLVANGNFATGDFTDWTLGGNYNGQLHIETNAQGTSTYAACLDSTGSDGTLSQTIATTAGQTYTLSFWLDMGAGGANNFSAQWNGQPVLSLTNVLNSSGYTEYTYVVTATGSTSTLEFSAAGSPWFVDNVALARNGASAPVVNAIAESPSSGDLDAGKIVTYTISLSEAVTVNTTGGSPTLTFNDGGTGTYVSGSGSNALTFSYTVLPGQNTSDLMVSAVNLNGAAIQDSAGNAANFSLTGVAQGSPVIDTTPPTVASVTATAGDYNAGNTLTLTLNMSEAVNVTGTPTLTLNDGGTATYTGGTGTNALTFSYTVAAGQNAAGLAVTGVNGTIADLAGNALNSTGLPETFAGVTIDTTTPTVASVATSGTGITAGSGDLTTGSVVTLTVNLGEAVTVNTTGGTPTLTLNDGGTATYTGGTGTNALTFSYTVAAGQNTADLAVTAVNLNSATIKDGAGNAANLTGAVTNPAGTLQIDTTAPTVASVATSGTGITAGSGDLTTGSVVTLTVNLGEAVTVNTTGGTPTLTLNDGGTATYTGGTGTNALTFSYTVAAGQNTADLAVTAVNLNSATIKDGAGNAANLTGAVTNPAGTLQIDTTAPTVASVATSGTGITAGSGDLTTGSVVTLTVNLGEAVTVNTTGGTPTLTLNDGGTATYTGGTGTNALTFSYTVAAGQNTADLAVTAVNLNSATIKDGAGNAANLTGAVTNPAGTLQIDTTTPTVASVATSGTGITAGSGDLITGSVVTLTVNLGEAVTVNTTGGTPTLTLNDGGTATYTGGTGTNALTFSYTVAAGQNTADLAVTAVNLNSATIKDGAGNAANLTGAVTNPAGTLQIDTTAPTVASVATSGTGITAGSGDLTTGSVVTLTVNLGEAVTVNTTGGTPTLTLNDGGTATYTGGTGTNALTFSYTVAAGQNTADLAVTAVNLNSATIKDGAGNAANLTGAVTNPAGTLQIDTTAPTVASVATSGTGITAGSGDLTTGSVVTLTVNLGEAVAVNTTGGTPTLTLNDGGTATYTGGTGTNALTFSYTVAAGQNTADLAVTAVNLNSATIKDGAGNAANLTGAVTNPAGTLQIDTTAPTVASVATSGTGITAGSGDLTTGSVVTLTVNLGEAVAVNTTGGTPTLTLNDGGTATYTGGTGTNALTFSYTVAAGQNTADLAVTAVNLNSATIKDGAGNAANLTGAVTNPAGTLQIDTTAPVISAIAESPSSGDLDAGKIVTYTISLSEAVTVNTTGGSPTLTFNDGGAGAYVSGSGSNALTFSYTVLPGQNTSDLMVSAVNLNGAAIQDSAGNAANFSLTGVAQGSPVIDTTPPTVASVTATAGDYNAGNTLTLTLNMSEAVNVTGTPTLTLNDGGSATYVGGSGTNALTFTYTVAAGQNTAGLAVTAVNGTIADLAGNALNSTGLPETFAGVTIDTTTPTVLSAVTTGTGITAGSGDLTSGAVVTLTVNLSEAVTVDTTNGTPTLTLNDGGIATYTGGTGTNALTFSYTVAAGQNTADLGITAVNLNSATVTDGNGNAANLTGAVTNPAGTLQIDTTTPTISSIADSPANGDFNAGKMITLTLGMNEVVTVNTTGGTPTLTLNDGGVATYVSGSGTNALTFTYTVVAGQNTPDLTVSTVNLNGAMVQDGAGNVASLSLTGLTQGSPQIDTTTPVISAIVESPSSGDLNAGKTVTLTLDMSEVMTVNTTGGTPTLTLNDGGVATYVSGAGTNALTFSYTVAAGQNTAGLKATALNLNSATITDGAGNAANLSLTGLTQAGPQIDTTTPAISAIVESPSSGDLNAGKTVTLTLDMSEVMTVNTTGGTPTLTLNDGGVATYVSGTGTSTLTFSYTVAAAQNTAALKATALNLNSATITDGAGNAANLSLTGLTQTGPQIDTTTPAISAIVESPSSGDLNAGKTVTLTLDMSEVMTVNTTGGTPTLTLNDGGVATYVSGTGTNALTFSYTVAAGQNTAGLKATALNLNSATITDGAGNNAANLSLTGLTQTGPQIDTSAPAAPLISFDKVIGNRATVVGTATAGSVVSIYEGTTLVGTTSSNSKGNWVFESSPLTKGAHTFTATATDAAGNVSATSIAFDPVVGAGPVINAAPVEVGNQYYIYNNGGSDVALTYAGAVVTAGEFGGWTPIGAAQTATGYDVAWQMTGANEYTVWATDSSGNVISNLTGAVSGTSYALESLESTFNQDLNGDGVIGVPATEIQVVGNQYYLDGISGSGPALQLGGTDVTVGQMRGWTAIAAAQTATGYDVAWKMTGANEYTVWATDSSGNAIANLTGGAVSGTSYALESIESTFNQDLNGDGVIGLTTTVIQVDGSTTLTEVANQFCFDGIGGSGPALKFAGANVTAGEFGGWTPIGAVQTASGYDVAWKMAGANEYTVWATDSSGNTIANLTGAVSGTSTALESLESTFNQDLNGDGVIGLYAAPGTAMQINTGISGSATIGAGATLELAGADSGSVTFASSKGSLVLDQSSSFSGQIFGFTGDGTLSGSDQIDMKDINFSTVQVSYTNGVLTMNDGVDTAKLNFSGSYVMANFKLASDGTGGTIVYDPPVTNFGPASGTGADTGSPPVTDSAGFGGTAGTDAPPIDSQNPTGFGSMAVADTPPDGPKNALQPLTDRPLGGPKNGLQPLTDQPLDGPKNDLQPLGGAGFQNGGASGTPPVTDPPMGGIGFQNGGAGGTPPVTDPPTGGIGFQNGVGGTPPVTDPPTGATGFQNGSLLAALAADAQTTLGYLLDGNAAGTLSATNGSQGANIALLGNYMASSFPAPTGSLAGAIQGAEGGLVGGSNSLLTNPHHA